VLLLVTPLHRLPLFVQLFDPLSRQLLSGLLVSSSMVLVARPNVFEELIRATLSL
jgi:hypothetical protein